MSVSVSMPQLGESVTEGTVTRWLKKEGERVEVDEPLLEVSTDKVDTEIPSPASGILRSIAVDEDETVAVGAQLAVIEDSETSDSAPAQTSPPAPGGRLGAAGGRRSGAGRRRAAQDAAESAPAAEPEPASTSSDAWSTPSYTPPTPGYAPPPAYGQPPSYGQPAAPAQSQPYAAATTQTPASRPLAAVRSADHAGPAIGLRAVDLAGPVAPQPLLRRPPRMRRRPRPRPRPPTRSTRHRRRCPEPARRPTSLPWSASSPPSMR